MEEAGESRGGRGVILTRRVTVWRLCPYPLLHCCKYVPLNCESGSISSAKPTKTTLCLSITLEGEGAGAMMSSPLVSGSSQTAAPFQFPFIVLNDRGAFFNLYPRRLLQLQPSLPTSSLIANFNPRHHQLQPRRLSISKPIAFLFSPLLLDSRVVLDSAAAR
jgi:hypothetical protein